jgi:Rho family protein
VIVGDEGCGKTSLLARFTLGYFPTHYVPTVFEHYVTDCWVDGISVQLTLWDTAGQEDYESVSPVAYSQSHVVIIGFSVDNSESLENVWRKWIEEAKERRPGIPVILVGLKKDLREDALGTDEIRKESLKFVTSREGAEIAGLYGARTYLECSSLTGEGVDNVFKVATRAALLTVKGEQGGDGCCVIL